MQNYGDFYGISLMIKDSELLEYKMIDNPNLLGCDDGNGVYIYHWDCKKWMQFKRGRWICPDCGEKLTKKKAYDFIDKLNKEGLEDYDEYY